MPHNPERDAPDPEVTVEPHEWKRLQGTGNIETVGIGPCAAVSVFGADRSVAYVGHFLMPDEVDQEELQTMINAAQDEIGSDVTKVWVGGASPEGDHGRGLAAQGRDLVETAVQETFPDATFTVQWLDQPGTINYAINVGTGTETVEVLYDDPPANAP